MTRQPLTIRRVRRLLDSGIVSSEQICSYCHSLAVAGEEVWRLNAFTHLTARDQLLEWARQSDHRRKHTHHHNHGKASTSSSPIFEGIPVSIKANIAVANMPLTAASRILGGGMANTPDVGYDADVVKVLLRDGERGGAILMGITNMDEFGMGSLGTTGIGGYTCNPTRYLRRLGAIQKASLFLRQPHSDLLGDNEWVTLIQKSHDEIVEMHHKAYKEEDQEEGIILYSTGGSSCGSAASVAHGSSLLSLGTDTGGSVRLPAAWCGVVGLKPSYGLFSRHGVVSYASSLDTVGILAPTVDCATTALDALAQRHGPSRDSTASFYPQSVSLTKSVYQKEVRHEHGKLSGIKVGIPAALAVKECPAAIQEVWAKAATFLQRQGAVVEIVSNEILSPNIVQKSLAAYYVVASAEASSNLSRYDGFRYGIRKHPISSNITNSRNPSTAAPTTSNTHGIPPLEQQYGATRIQGFGTEVTRRILCGTSVLSSDRFHTHYEAAARLRALLCQQLSQALTHVDVLLFPTTLFSPCRLDDNNGRPDNTEMLANDVMTVPASLAGLPAVSIPLPQLQSSDSWSTTDDVIFPPSIQLVGSRLGEATVLRVARVFEDGDMKDLEHGSLEQKNI